MTANVMLKSVADIQSLNTVASQQDFNLSVSRGSVIVDARSLLALFTLLGNQVSIVAPDGVSPKEFFRSIKRMKLDEV